ncbi:MAG: hypothetical protein M1830_002656 [Pleopsidium flavum]|nr:MAG: hypothetical protein M1830_002656 [Pleopsidium flavum]
MSRWLSSPPSPPPAPLPPLIAEAEILYDALSTHPTFYQAVQKSDIAHLLPEKDSVPSERVVALGAAEMTKDKMESQSSDCLESDECETIREEADMLAGRPTWIVPPPHSEL